MKKGLITVEFADQIELVDSFKISNTFEGVFEGNLALVSKMILDREIAAASKSVNFCQKVIIPDEKQPLPRYRYEIVIKHYVPKKQPKYYGDSDWYFLKLIWFDFAPDPAMSLRDYICSITKPMNFFDVCEKLTEKQINYWC